MNKTFKQLLLDKLPENWESVLSFDKKCEIVDQWKKDAEILKFHISPKNFIEDNNQITDTLEKTEIINGIINMIISGALDIDKEAEDF